MIIPLIEGDEHFNTPFKIGQINPHKGYIHVFDELTLDVILRELDTIVDFLNYLNEKEKAISNNIIASAAGEEDLLGYYSMINDNKGNGIIDFPSNEMKEKFGSITIGEGAWDLYSKSEQYKVFKTYTKDSYLWDNLIEHFSKHLVDGSAVSLINNENIINHENAIRFLANTSRFERSSLARSFLEKIKDVPKNRRSARIAFLPTKADTCYIFLIEPRLETENYQDYRKLRLQLLYSYIIVSKFKYPEKKLFCAIGTENIHSEKRSEDLLCTVIDKLEDDEVQEAKRLITEENILKSGNIYLTKHEIHDVNSLISIKKRKIGRNEKCFCGSGKKFKCCHGN